MAARAKSKYRPNTIDFDEGWSVFDCDGMLRILRLDCPSDARENLPAEPMFTSDRAALYHVKKNAATSQYHAAALALHRTKTPGY